MEDTETMVKVTGVKFKKNGKMYYFDPGELELQQGDGVIVETARGMEFARVTMGLKDIRESDVMHPLKKVVRIADEDDLRRHEENESKKGHAMEVCREKIQKHHLDTNHHVNNCQYVRMAQQYLPEKFTIRQMRAEYRQQAKLHDTICPMVKYEDEKIVVSLNDDNQAPYAVVEFMK